MYINTVEITALNKVGREIGMVRMSALDGAAWIAMQPKARNEKNTE